MSKPQLIQTILGCLLAILILSSCQDVPTTTVEIQFQPNNTSPHYEAVQIDPSALLVKSMDDQTWHPISQSSPGHYTAIKLEKGVESLSGEIVILHKKPKHIKLILGHENTLLLDDQVIPLETVHGNEARIKLQLYTDSEGEINYKLVLVFDHYKQNNPREVNTFSDMYLAS
ncbi:hypothetical protein [Reichenbachiella agariperforans]|uniref:hypothetical protein n=1 Tax=Reichenbachiella agariperforans TaxID=156994 RepID=UPI001C08AA1D|nr:hypothetical protein [Reichenbachiella agariperforans]MBU2913108.1 hypothetical protein [Reichenbachiella agariperforans]